MTAVVSGAPHMIERLASEPKRAPDPCPNCSHGWHGLDCTHAQFIQTATGGAMSSCPCASSCPEGEV